MKKIALLTSLFAIVANSAFAGALATHTPTTGGAVSIKGGASAPEAAAAPTALVKTSTKVNGLVEFSDNQGYLIVTKHDTGSKTFGTCNSVNNIYWKQVTAGALNNTTDITGITSGSYAATSFVGNGWTSY
jgi:hypothetical protein